MWPTRFLVCVTYWIPCLCDLLDFLSVWPTVHCFSDFKKILGCNNECCYHANICQYRTTLVCSWGNIGTFKAKNYFFYIPINVQFDRLPTIIAIILPHILCQSVWYGFIILPVLIHPSFVRVFDVASSFYLSWSTHPLSECSVWLHHFTCLDPPILSQCSVWLHHFTCIDPPILSQSVRCGFFILPVFIYQSSVRMIEMASSFYLSWFTHLLSESSVWLYHFTSLDPPIFFQRVRCGFIIYLSWSTNLWYGFTF